MLTSSPNLYSKSQHTMSLNQKWNQHQVLEGRRTCHPKICHLSILIASSCSHLSCRERLSLNSYLPERHILQKEHRNFSPGNSPTKEDWFLSQERRQTVTNGYLPPVLLRAHSSFPKITYSPLRGLRVLSPLPIQMVCKPELLWITHFPWVSPMYTWGLHVNKLVLLLLICLL